MLIKKKDLNHLMILMCRSVDCEELAKATKGITSVLQFITTTFSSTSVTTLMSPCPHTV